MIQMVADDLNNKDQSDFHKEMLKRVRDNVSLATESLSQGFTQWDINEEIFQSKRQMDDKDKKAKERGEPMKLMVPMAYSQIMVWAAFVIQMYTQRPTFYELTGSGIEDEKAAKIAEALLERDLDESKFLVRLFQFLLDMGRFGRGIFKSTWMRDTAKEWKNQPVQQSPFLGGGASAVQKTALQLVDVVRFLGNKVTNISPYRFYVDPRLPFVDYQDGDFCGSESDVTRNWLLRMQKNGLFAGIEHVGEFSPQAWSERSRHTRTGIKYQSQDGKASGVLYTEMQMEVVPRELKIGSKPIGDEDYPIKYLVCVANDSRVIRCEPLGYLHGNYTYYAAEFTPDMHNDINIGISDLINELSETITWLFNSRISSVRKTIQNQLVVDPQGVEMRDLENRNPVIRLKKGVSASGVDRWIKQLQVTDVTQSHIADANQCIEIIRLVTGINENATGQYSKGRRAAAQTEAVNAAGSMRLLLPARLADVQAIRPMGRDLLSNLRDGLDEDQIVRVMGLQVMQPQSPYAPGPQDVAQFLTVNKSHLVGNYDFLPLDTTQPSQKQDRAQILQDLLMQCVQNPQALVMFGIDVNAILQETLTLLGIRNPERFKLQATQQQALMQAAQMLLAAGNPAGQIGMGASGSAQMQTQTAALPQSQLPIPEA